MKRWQGLGLALGLSGWVAAPMAASASDSMDSGARSVSTASSLPDHAGPEWRRVEWGDVRFRTTGSSPGGELDEARLAEVVGGRTVARIGRHAYGIGASGPLTAVWRGEGRGTLRVLAGRIPVAELIDEDGDRRVDLVRLAFYR